MLIEQQGIKEHKRWITLAEKKDNQKTFKQIFVNKMWRPNSPWVKRRNKKRDGADKSVHNKKGWWQTNIFDVILHITPLF